MRKNIYFKNPERLERLGNILGLNQSEIVDKALEMLEKEHDIAQKSLKNAFSAVCEGIVNLENIRDYQENSFTEEMNMVHIALIKCFDALQPLAQKVNTFYRVDNYFEASSGSFVGFYSTLEEAESNLNSEFSGSNPVNNQIDETTPYGQITVFTSQFTDVKEAWAEGDIEKTLYYYE